MFTAINFEQGGSDTVNGLTIGLGVGLNKYLSLYGGITIAKGQELSHGFQTTASAFSKSATCGNDNAKEWNLLRFR